MVPSHEYNKTRENFKKRRKEGPVTSNLNSDDSPTVPIITEATLGNLHFLLFVLLLARSQCAF